LLVIRDLLDQLPANRAIGFGVLDPKNELFSGSLRLLSKRLSDLGKTDADAALELRKRVVILDFAADDPVSSYNILARPRAVEPGYFASTRADLVLDLLPGGDGLSLGASAILRQVMLLVLEFDLPITWVTNVLHDPTLRHRLLSKSKNDAVKT